MPNGMRVSSMLITRQTTRYATEGAREEIEVHDGCG